MQEWTFSLPEGRTLGGAEYGDPHGRPVMLFHGQPGNRLFHPDIELTRQLGVRLLVPDRPGYGLSGFYPEMTLLDWPGDVSAIADHFNLPTFDLIGFSGGGPYALACAYAIPQRLKRILIAAGAPPMHLKELRRKMSLLPKINYFLTRYLNFLFRGMFSVYWRQARKNPSGFIDVMRSQVSAADLQVITDPQYGEMLLAVWKENLRVDCAGYVHDARLLMDAWGFDLEEISHPVELWWGTQDQSVPLVVMEYFSKLLPNSEKKLLPDAGHFGILVNWERILLNE